LQFASKNTKLILKQMKMSKNILVTGASSGFGLLIANELHRKGYWKFRLNWPANSASKWPPNSGSNWPANSASNWPV